MDKIGELLLLEFQSKLEYPGGNNLIFNLIINNLIINRRQHLINEADAYFDYTLYCLILL